MPDAAPDDDELIDLVAALRGQTRELAETGIRAGAGWATAALLACSELRHGGDAIEVPVFALAAAAGARLAFVSLRRALSLWRRPDAR